MAPKLDDYLSQYAQVDRKAVNAVGVDGLFQVGCQIVRTLLGVVDTPLLATCRSDEKPWDGPPSTRAKPLVQLAS